MSEETSMLAPIGKMLIGAGLLIAVAGVLLLFSDKIPFLGKLPGDISVKKDNFQLYVPITTCIVLSLLLSLIMWLFSYFGKK